MRSRKEIEDALKVQEANAKENLQKRNRCKTEIERTMFTKFYNRDIERVNLLKWVLNEE